MDKFAKGALLGGLIAVAFGGVATAQLNPNLTAAELKCEAATSKSGGKYVGALSKCATKCQQGFFKGDLVNYPGGASDCYDPPYGGATARCANGDGDPLLIPKSADAKFRTAMRKACDPAFKVGSTADCPECYDAAGGNAGCGDAGYAGAHQQDIGNQVASFGPGVFCKTTGATPAEQKCQQNTAKVLSKHVASVDKCFDKCFKNASKSVVNGADCVPNPVLPNDPATQTCINTASGKATLGVDKLCTTAGVNIANLCPQFCSFNSDCDTGPPDGVCTNRNCSAGNTTTSAYNNGSQWTTLVTNAIAGNVVDSGLGPDTGIYCSN
jgi:hypothetical protein